MTTTITRREVVEKAIQDTRKLLWNASQQCNASSVFRLQEQLDQLIDERRKGFATGR